MKSSLNPISHLHLRHLIIELRASALAAMERALLSETGDVGAGLDAALANDAADAIESMLAAMSANDNGARG